MTTEQTKTIKRCRDMIKRAFPEMDGKFIFKLDSSKHGEKGISVDMFLPDLKMKNEPGLQTVDLTL